MTELAAAIPGFQPESTLLLEEIQPLQVDFIPQIQKQPAKRGRRGGVSLKAEGTPSTADVTDGLLLSSSTAGLQISKAASRMRQYRADHKNDLVWLSKEAERMRKMRAKRKEINGGSQEALRAVDEFGVPIEKPPKARRVPRSKSVRTGDMKLDISIDSNGQPDEAGFTAAMASANGRSIKSEEFHRKEAERIRRYRALKRQDQVWKDKDAERMRLYRAKRKAYAKANGKMALVPHEPAHYGIPMMLETMPMTYCSTDGIAEDTLTVMDSSESGPSQHTMKTEAVESDSENEANEEK